MFSIILKLCKIMASGSSIFQQLSVNIKKGPKGVIKSIFLIILALYLVCVLCGMYIVFMINTYKVLSAAGNTHLMPLVSMMAAISVILFFGFTSVAASYYTGQTDNGTYSSTVVKVDHSNAFRASSDVGVFVSVSSENNLSIISLSS